jgi:hypothetical protein
MPGEDRITVMMASLGMEDMNIPELKLIQATGGDYAKKEANAKPGQFFVSTTNELHDNVNVQVLMVSKQRTFWGRTDITDDPPICSSLDGTNSIDGQTCKECPHFRERAAIDKEERRKECQLGYVVLALDENQMPLVIRLAGISADAGRDLNAMLYFNKGIRANRGGFFFRITSWDKKSASGNAFAFKFTLLKDKFPAVELQQEYMRVAGDMGLLKPVEPVPVSQRIAETIADPKPLLTDKTETPPEESLELEPPELKF